MRAVVQRVKECSVTVEESVTGQIDDGILVYLGVEREDTEDDLSYVIDKTLNLRIFIDGNGKMNLSVKDIGGSLLVVPQFTICADIRKGRRPSYNHAATPEEGKRFYEKYIELVRSQEMEVQEGRFGALMHVSYTNEGPVTIIIDSKKRI